MHRISLYVVYDTCEMSFKLSSRVTFWKRTEMNFWPLTVLTLFWFLCFSLSICGVGWCSKGSSKDDICILFPICNHSFFFFSFFFHLLKIHQLLHRIQYLFSSNVLCSCMRNLEKNFTFEKLICSCAKKKRILSF